MTSSKLKQKLSNLNVSVTSFKSNWIRWSSSNRNQEMNTRNSCRACSVKSNLSKDNSPKLKMISVALRKIKISKFYLFHSMPRRSANWNLSFVHRQKLVMSCRPRLQSKRNSKKKRYGTWSKNCKDNRQPTRPNVWKLSRNSPKKHLIRAKARLKLNS